MNKIKYWFWRVLFYLFASTLRIILAAVFWGRKKSVPPVNNEILLKPAHQLAKEIREGKLKSEEVIHTYIKRISEVEPFINAIVQENFDDAIKEGRKIDELIESEKFSTKYLSKEKPLLGVPFTVKCLLKVKGFQDNAASLVHKNRIAETDAQPVALLKKAGGIFLALTNSPEFGLSIETVNKVYGKTCNPYDVTRTPGGSSGGEAALISAAGSIIGLGNDLLGSVRIPSHYCCLFAHKPSANAISSEGAFIELPSVLQDLYSVGPMCRFSEDLIIMMKILHRDKEAINLQKEVNFKDIKIYYQTRIENSWIFNTDAEIVQAVQNAASYFKAKYGTEVKEVRIPHLIKTNAILMNLLSSRLHNIIQTLTDGKVKKLNGIIELIKMPFGKCRFTFSTIIATCFGKWPSLLSKNHESQCERQKEEIKNEFNKLLDECSLFFCPTLPKTAPYHRETFVHFPSTCYTSTFNMLGLPATQCPMGFNKQGLPLGIQIVGQKGNDMMTLLAASELEKAFGGWSPP